MVIPLHDDNPTTTRPWVTAGILIACVLAYLWQQVFLSADGGNEAKQALGLVPAMLTDQEMLAPGSAVIPAWATVLTYMFMHGGFWHLAGNMLFLWIFGNNIEEAMGHTRFLVFYIACGLVAALSQVLPNPGSLIPIVGASGAISGVLGAYMLLFPRARVLLGLPLGFVNVEFGRFPAIWVLAIWFALQLLFVGIAAARAVGESQGGIVFGAHIAGFIAGCALVTIFKRRHVPLWRRY
jgi:membrane associated rhomboid family serine protease